MAVPLQVINDRVEFLIKKCVDLLANDVTEKRFGIRHHHMYRKKTLDVSKNAILDWFYEFLSKSDKVSYLSTGNLIKILPLQKKTISLTLKTLGGGGGAVFPREVFC